MRIIKPIIAAVFMGTAGVAIAAEPLSCMSVNIETSQWSPAMTITNQCGQAVDMQNSLIEFKTNHNLNGSVWGDFNPLAYPQQPTVSSESDGSQYKATIPLSFSEGNEWWKPNTKLKDGESIRVVFSGAPDTEISHVKLYPLTIPEVKKGTMTVTIGKAPSAGLSLSDISISGDGGYQRTLSHIQWGGRYTIENVPYGQYQVNAKNLTVGSDSYQASITPTQVTINSEEAVNTSVSYHKVQSTGALAIQLTQAMPEQGITSPMVHVIEADSGQEVTSKIVPWGQSVNIDNLKANETYQLTMDSVQGKEHMYSGEVISTSPITVIGNQITDVTIRYQGHEVRKQDLYFMVSGLLDETNVNLVAQDNNGYMFNISGSEQTIKAALPVNRQYHFTVSPVTIDGERYAAKLEPTEILLATGKRQSVDVIFRKQTDSMKISPYVDVTLGAITRWDSATSSMQPTGLIDVVDQTGLKSLHLAFITARNGCSGTWAGYPVSTEANAYGVPVFKALREKGVSLTVALGGLSGQYLAQACGSTEELVNAYDTVVQAYQPEGLDFDVENAMQTNNVQLDRMMDAIKVIKSRYPNIKISFTLPVLPSGLVPGMGENVIKRAAMSGLSDYGVNIMAMDYGNSFVQKSMAEYSIDALKNTHAQVKKYYPEIDEDTLWTWMEVTPMIGLNDTIKLNFSLKDIQDLKSFAETHRMGMMSYWSITRDHPCEGSYASPTCSSTNPNTGAANQTEDYQYAKILLGH